MRFKRLSSALLAAALTATSVGIYADAAEDTAMKNALTIVKERLDIPEDFSEFTYRTSTEYGITQYSFTWSKPDNTASMRVSVTGKIIKSVNIYREDDYRDGTSFAKMSNAKLKAAAKKYIEQMNPTVLKSTEIDEDSLSIALWGNNATLSFKRVCNGIPVTGQNGSVTVNKDTGELIRYNYNWINGASFKKSDKVITEKEAKASYKKNFDSELVYTVSYDWETNEQIPHLIYQQTDFGQINAFNGEKSTFDDYGTYGGYEDEDFEDDAVEEEADSANPSTGGENGAKLVSFTKDELDKLEKEGSLVKAEDALILGSTMGIVKPAGGKQMGIHIRDAAGNIATEVLLMPVENYDLKICGTQVNTGNAADILGDGVFQYLPEQNILAVKSSCEWHDAPIIESWIEELGISSMDGEYVLTAVDASAIVLHKDASIGGTGTLTVSGTNAIYADGCELMLYKAKVNATGTQYGISGSGAKLTIFESSTKESTPGTTITAKGTTAAIAGFADITLNGCYIKTPEDGEVKGGNIVDASGNIAKEVEIVFGTKPGETPLVNPFVDVIEGKFYYDAVLWAYYHDPQITNGVDKTHFAPDNTCTRAQIVTFLWRAKGCPEPTLTKSPFTDVTDSKAYYYKAVLWAVENEITNGTTATTFSPNAGCTRAQVVTFLWRTEGKPAPTSSVNPFTDVTGGYYYDAVLWAVENKITNGTSADKFSPNATCTRGQIVTFLYRDLVK